MMPRAKPEGETQAGNLPMRGGLGRQGYSSLKTAGRRTGVTDHSCPLPSTPPATEPWVASKLTPGPRKGGEGRGRYHLDSSREPVDRKTFRRGDGLYLPTYLRLTPFVTEHNNKFLPFTCIRVIWR